jgi:hypothetical protein
MQSLNPLAIENVGLRPTRSALRSPWIDQIDLEATLFEKLEQRNSINAG